MNCKNIIKTTALSFFMFTGLLPVSAQNAPKPSAAVLGIDSKGIIQDMNAVSYMVKLELEKTGAYAIMDKYDVSDVVKSNNIDIRTCLSKSCVVNAGKLLGVQKMITGSVERFDEKIVITLKVIDVATDAVEKMNTTEYLNLQPELQKMIEISVKKLVGIEPDQQMVDMLIDYDIPVESPKTKLKLNGPRMGASFAFGDAGTVLTAPEDEGGFNMYPMTFQFGWQQEKQYLTAGNFQALIEFVGLVGGLESGKFIPSVTVLNGFRMGKGGWEFGFGPSFRVVTKARGFFDERGIIGKPGEWHLEPDWSYAANDSSSVTSEYDPYNNPYSIVSRLDSRGSARLSTSMVFSFGKTFRSGYLNMPVNLYVSPRKEGTVVGFSFGFNIYRKPKVM
jgi:hypothetical protein